MARNYNERVLVAVNLLQTFPLKYGFNSGLRESLRDNFGQGVIDLLAPPPLFVLGANRPKPYRATKRLTTGYESSWCSWDKVPTLKSDGYRIQRPKFRSPNKTKLTAPVYVTIRGIKYAWPLSSSGLGIAGSPDTSSLGLQNATADDTDLVWGASFPKPPKASTQTANGTYSTFVDPERVDNLSDEWFISKPGKTTL